MAKKNLSTGSGEGDDPKDPKTSVSVSPRAAVAMAEMEGRFEMSKREMVTRVFETLADMSVEGQIVMLFGERFGPDASEALLRTIPKWRPKRKREFPLPPREFQ